jgi:hypothetical protein
MADEEWRDAVRDLNEADRAPFDDPLTYADTFDPNGVRYGYR